MKSLRHTCVLPVLLLCTCVGALCAGTPNTPESTLDEVIAADNIDAVILHLPDTLAANLKSLPAQKKAALAAQLLVSNRLKQAGLKISKTAAGQWDVTDNKGNLTGHMKLKNSVVSGSDAVLVLQTSTVREAVEDIEKRVAVVILHLQDGRWRVMQLGDADLTSIEDYIKHLGPNVDFNEAATVGAIRTLNTALIAYQTTYPDAGFPQNLAALSGDGSTEPSALHAELIEPDLAAGIKSGYKFHYTRTGPSSFSITARPVEYGETGKRSFYTDQTGFIRVTSEDREPTNKDPAL